ncbi:MAG: hypothetical protein EHM23_13390 [Acidobacteria bacterium]|nr:MAG: hypothetical protein EHM23_13390 [Acidobacteriota bacterium]
MTYPSPAVEISRRLFLVGGIVASAWLGWLTDLRPYVDVSRPEHRPTAVASGSSSAEEEPDALVAESREPEQKPMLTVSGPAWEAFFFRVDQTFSKNLPVTGWEHRITWADLKQARKENGRRAVMTEYQRQEELESVQRVKEKYGIDTTFTGNFHRLYFQRDEPPFDTLRADNGTYILALDGKPERQLQITLLAAHELIPFSDVNPLPTSFTYPLRKWSLWAFGIGLGLFLLLPYPRRPANVIAYQRWRILLGDVASTLMFGMFFVLPMPIIGGSMEAVTTLALLIPFWFMACFGLFAFYWAAHAAVYCLVVRDGGFDIRTLLGQEAFDYADIAEIQGALLRPPRWLIVLSFVAALLGKSGAARIGQTGRALMLAGSAANGMRVTRKDGRSRFVWVSDQMGGKAMEHLDAFVAGLEKAGVPIKDTVFPVRALFPPS